MSLRINTNIMAINTHRNMQMTDLALSKSLEKLSSGLRVNRASDDAAGLSISESLRAQIRGLAQAERNAQDGISLLNLADGALNEMQSILQRIRELAVQAANGTLTISDRESVQRETEQLIQEIHNIARYTSFNGMTLFDGTFSAANPMVLQVGANSGQTLSFTMPRADAIQLNLGTDLGMRDGVPSGVAGDGILDDFLRFTPDTVNASAWMPWLDTVIGAISGLRGRLGAATNRLEHTINNIAVSRENLAAAESRIRDVDMANEMSRLTRAQILMQSGTAMLAQANAQPQNVLRLLS